MKTSFFRLLCRIMCLSAICVSSVTWATAKNENSKKETAEAAPAKTYTITGRILDKDTNEPLAGVLLKVCGSGKSIYTDLDGNYTITEVVPGQCEVKVELISYETKVVKLTPVNNMSLNLTMSK